MPRTRNIVAAEVKAAFLVAEQSAERSAADHARCVAIMIDARPTAGFAPDAGLKALHLIGASQRLSFKARQKMMAAHKLMADLPAELGITVAYGPTDCPPDSPRGTLTLVDAA